MASLLLRYHPSTAGGAVSLPLLKLCTQLNTVLHAGVFSPQIANNRRWPSDGIAPSSHKIHVVHLLPVIIAFHFETPVHALRLPALVMTQQLSTGKDDYGQFMVERCTKTILSDDNSRHLTACYLPVKQPQSESIRTPFVYQLLWLFTHVARKPARNNSCGLLSKNVGRPWSRQTHGNKIQHFSDQELTWLTVTLATWVHWPTTRVQTYV